MCATGLRWIGFLCLLATVVPLFAADDPLDDPEVKKMLTAMANASTWYHPDLFGEFAGARRYAHRDFKGALKYFEIGAYYADKFSQLSIGLMHLNGEGTRKDPVTAYAWLDLAAERGYPDFVATRDRVKAELTPAQLAEAAGKIDGLRERYADTVAKPRMEQQLRRGREQMTGSLTGFDYGVDQASSKGACGTGLVVGGQAMPQAGCASANFYAKERWEPDLYFASRDRSYTATVTVGAVEAAAGAADDKARPAAPPGGAQPAAAADKH
ncbi:MAG TPA: sel1 repeat family protein [Dokdonella sp.]